MSATEVPRADAPPHPLLTAALRRLSVDEFRLAEDHDDRYFEEQFASTQTYVERFEGALDFVGKSVLDVGCGYGNACMHLVEQGAARAVGIDVDSHVLSFGKRALETDYAHLRDRVAFHDVDATGWETEERFDLVISKDSFEHIADPEGYMAVMKRYLEPGGTLAIGFGPLWRSPYGAHQKWMSRFPWTHLLFPESVVMAEWQRLGFPDGAETYEQITGSLNKMTLARFRSVTKDPEFERLTWKVNQTSRRSGRVLKALRFIPGLGELCAFNVYTTMRYVPAGSGDRPAA